MKCCVDQGVAVGSNRSYFNNFMTGAIETSCLYIDHYERARDKFTSHAIWPTVTEYDDDLTLSSMQTAV